MPRKKQSKKVSKKAGKKREWFNFSSNAPLGVKIISVLHYILTGIYALFGIFIIIYSKSLATNIADSASLLSSDVAGITVILIIFSVFLIGVGVLEFFVARGLWRVKQWARILAIILAILGTVSAIYSLIVNFKYSQIVQLLIDSAIGIYLLFSEEVKEAFKK
jgi:hypothetical protein